MATEVSIFGLDPVIAAVIIAAVAVSFRTVFGLAGKSKKEFDYILMLRTAMSAFFSSVVIVIPTLSHISLDATNETIGIIVLTQIAAVMGVDAGQHSLAKRIGKHMAAKKTMSGAEFDAHAASQMQVQDLKATEPLNPATDDVTPEEEGEDVPPGKSDA